VISVIIPACNEARVIGRTVGGLVSSAEPGELDVVVVANGCTDGTADIAAGFGPPVRVLTMAKASKTNALAAGDDAAWSFPRIYMDADVQTRAADLRALGDALQAPGVLAAGPEREFAMTGCPWAIRRYYEVWTRLPEVQRGLFGRGLIAFSKEGHGRISGLPQVIADDLAISLAFAPDERVVVPGARVLIRPPRTLADLMRRRVRTAEGIAQLGRAHGTPDPATAQTRPADLLAMTAREPRLAVPVAVFLSVAVAGRLRARRAIRRNDYSAWHRDESSRS
jgi:hypothetical protein